MPKETTAWQCNFCRRVSRTKAGAERHESACKYNPARRACHTCKHFDPKAEIESEIPAEEEMFFQEFFGEVQVNRTYQTMFCKHFSKPISEKPYFEECEYYEWPHADTPMPGTCFYWEPKEDSNV